MSDERVSALAGFHEELAEAEHEFLASPQVSARKWLKFAKSEPSDEEVYMAAFTRMETVEDALYPENDGEIAVRRALELVYRIRASENASRLVSSGE